MKLKSVFVLLLLFSVYSKSKAENPPKLSFRIEFGGNQVNSSLNEKWNIRQDVGSYYYDSGSSNSTVSTFMYVTHLAIKPEVSFFDNKIAVSSGVRFSNISSDLTMNYDNANLKKFFYLRYNTNGINTEFARASAVSQSNNYLGIPFDVRLIPISLYKIDLYLKTGIELNFKVGSKTSIDFVNEEMSKYENDIIENVGVKVNGIYSTWSSAIGFSFGNKLKYNLEFLLPSFFITKNNSSLVSADMFTGFQCSIQFPVK